MIKAKSNTLFRAIPSSKSTTMKNIFADYITGTREWTYIRKRFTETEFRSTFTDILPNDILHDAALAFLATTHLDVMLFSVPMNRSVPPGMRRDVLFVRQDGDSEYWNMFSFLSDYPIRAFDYGHSGLMSEYDIIDLVETSNDAHQRALIETWFDINNWFRILTSWTWNASNEDIEDVINGRAQELNAAADDFVPELTPLQMQALGAQRMNQQQQQVFAQWSVLDLL